MKACQYYVGLFIGKGSAAAIMHYYNVSMVMATVLGIVQIIILWALKEPIIKMYTN